MKSLRFICAEVGVGNVILFLFVMGSLILGALFVFIRILSLLGLP